MTYNKSIILLPSVLCLVIHSQLHADTTKQEDYFKQQILFAESSNRFDVAESALTHWLSIDSNNPEALFFQAQINILKGDITNAKKNINDLEKTYANHPELNKLKSLLDVQGSKKLKLQEARFLAKNQRTAEAVTLYNQLFPYGMPTSVIEVEYLELMSKLNKADFEQAKATLIERNIQYPNNPDYQPALKSLLDKKAPTEAALEAITDKNATDTTQKINALTDLPVEKLTFQAIDNLTATFPHDASVKTKAKQLKQSLINYQNSLNEPGYKAKLHGFKLLDEQKYDLAEKSFLFAKSIHPSDPEIFKGLGRVRLNQSQHDDALALFIKGKDLDKDPDNNSEWNSLISTAQYWGSIKRADNLAESNQDAAIVLYKKAILQDPKEIYGYLAIAKLLAKNKSDKEADEFFINALKIENTNVQALRGRINLRVDNNKPTEALNLVKSFTAAQQKVIEEDLDSIKIDSILNDAETALTHQDRKKANDNMSSAMNLKTVSPWQVYKMANILNQLNRKEEADDTIKHFLSVSKPSSDSYFASALYLAKQNKLAEALTEIDKIAIQDRTKNIIENQQRIWMNYQFNAIDTLITQDKPHAISRLKLVESEANNDPDFLITITKYWLDLKDTEQAKRTLLTLEPQPNWSLNTHLSYGQLCVQLKEFDRLDYFEKNVDLTNASTDQKQQIEKLLFVTKINKAKNHIANGDKKSANQIYFSILQKDPLFTSVYTELTNLLAKASDEKSKAKANVAITEWVDKYINQLNNTENYSELPEVQKIQLLIKFDKKEQAEKAMRDLLTQKGQTDESLYDASKAALSIKKWQTAEDLSYAALQANKNDNNKTNPLTLTESDKKNLFFSENNNWLAKNVKSNIETLRKQTDGYVTLFPDYRFGTNTSVMGAAVEAKVPFKRLGHFLFRINPVSLNAGNQFLNAKDFGSSLVNPCPNCGSKQLQATGVGYNVGWMGEHWVADIGRTPENFLVSDVVGGLRVDGDIKSFSWAVNASKRPIKNTTLSYAGLTDPVTNKVWGGARQSGISVNLGFDNGGPIGIWSNWQYQYINGQNLKTNTKYQGQIGLYGPIWKDKNNLANIDWGLNTLFMSYNNNQNNFTYGNGGYFSPQGYASVSFPLTVYGRRKDWSYAVRVSGAYSISKTSDANYYPNDPLLQQNAVALDPGAIYLGATSNAFTYGITSIIEKRITDHWSIGARAQLQRSPFYNPSNIGLYLKYDFNEHWSPIDTPPKVPYLLNDYNDF